MTFAPKADGTIDHFTMVAVSPLADFSFDHQDLYFTPEKPEAGKNQARKKLPGASCRFSCGPAPRPCG